MLSWVLEVDRQRECYYDFYYLHWIGTSEGPPLGSTMTLAAEVATLAAVIADCDVVAGDVAAVEVELVFAVDAAVFVWPLLFFVGLAGFAPRVPKRQVTSYRLT